MLYLIWLEVIVGRVWLHSQATVPLPQVALSVSEQYVYTASPVAQLMYMSAGVRPCVRWICAAAHNSGTGWMSVWESDQSCREGRQVLR